MDKCERFTKLNTNFQKEIKEHKIQENHNKNPTKESTEYLRIGKALEKSIVECSIEKDFSPQHCQALMDGKETWRDELEFYGNKWYIKPFMTLNGSMKKNKLFLDDLDNLYKEECQKKKKNI